MLLEIAGALQKFLYLVNPLVKGNDNPRRGLGRRHLFGLVDNFFWATASLPSAILPLLSRITILSKYGAIALSAASTLRHHKSNKAKQMINKSGRRALWRPGFEQVLA